MKKVVESVASVIQVLPPERLIGPLMVKKFDDEKKRKENNSIIHTYSPLILFI